MIDIDVYEEWITGILEPMLTGKEKIVLYPNGEIAELVRAILNAKYDMTPIFTVDNMRYDGEKVLNLEQAAGKTQDDIYYLVCSDKKEIYDVIREKLSRYIRKEQIIDLFPNMYESFSVEVNNVLDMIDCELGKMRI